MTKYIFKLTVEVSQEWVEDGMTKEVVQSMIIDKIGNGELQPYATPTEVTVSIK